MRRPLDVRRFLEAIVHQRGLIQAGGTCAGLGGSPRPLMVTSTFLRTLSIAPPDWIAFYWRASPIMVCRSGPACTVLEAILCSTTWLEKQKAKGPQALCDHHTGAQAYFRMLFITE